MEVIEHKGLKMFPAAPGRCAFCATKHPENHAHNLQSMFYQVHFKLKWKRDRTWADACAHLSEEQREAWREAMESLGHQWTEPADGKAIREPYAVVEA